MKVSALIQSSFQINLNQGESHSNSQQLKSALANNAFGLYLGLYDSLVKKHNGQRLEGQLSHAQLRVLNKITQRAKNSLGCPVATKAQLETLQVILKQYTLLLNAKEQNQPFALRKSEMMLGQAEHGMRHTLVTLHGKLYENLTWVSESEKQHIKAQLGLFGELKLNREKSETRNIFGLQEEQEKVNLGQGGFGRAGFARSIDENER